VGAFGDRFAKVAEVYGADVRRLEVEWGQAATPDAVRAALVEERGVKAVLLTHNETSTGVTNPIPELAAAIREVAPTPSSSSTPSAPSAPSPSRWMPGASISS